MAIKTTNDIKIGILIREYLTEFEADVLKDIIKNFPFCLQIAIIDDRPQMSLLQKIKKNIKKKRGMYIIIMFFQKILKKQKKQISAKEFLNDVELVKTQNIYSIDMIKKIKDKNLDILLLINGFGIIKKSLLKAAKSGILSYHHGDMRKYRGMPPGFWELYNNESEMGATVQLLNAGLDKGFPVEEIKLQIYRTDTLNSLNRRIYQNSTKMMTAALIKILNPNYRPLALERVGKLYTLPNFRQYIFLRIKILYRKLFTI